MSAVGETQSDSGFLLLREVDERFGLFEQTVSGI